MLKGRSINERAYVPIILGAVFKISGEGLMKTFIYRFGTLMLNAVRSILKNTVVKIENVSIFLVISKFPAP